LTGQVEPWAATLGYDHAGAAWLFAGFLRSYADRNDPRAK
jgi:hypothetical protein